MTATYDNLLLERDQAVALVTFNRPAVLNAMNAPTLEALRRAVLDLRRDDGVRVVILTGAGHLWLGRRSKGLILLVALPLMFAIGLGIHGRLFPFELSEPLVGLAALADLGIGAVYFIAGALGYGMGDVRSVTYEYGNAFLIVAGLLNLLVVIDAYDIAVGRK